MTRYLDTIPEPWSVDDIRAAIMNKIGEAQRTIDDTAGGRLWNAVEELDDTVWVFQTSADELFQVISLFSERTKDSGFWEETNKVDSEYFCKEVKRKLFYTTTSVMALVEVSRIFNKKWPVAGYDDKLKAYFATPGLHRFLQDLRNYNSHRRIVAADWVINYDLEKGGRVARFVVVREDLLAWDGWKAEAKLFIENAGESIDIGATLFEYKKQVKSFYEWLKGAVLVQYAGLLQQYFEYKRIHQGLNQQMKWSLILGHVPAGLNPYQYLARYLTADQLEKVMSFEHRSDAQIKSLVSVLDMEQFCDTHLMSKVKKLFQMQAES